MISVNVSAAKRGIPKNPRFFPVLLMIVVALPAQDQPQRKADKSVGRDRLDAETLAVADEFWKKILPQCGDSRYYAGSELEVHIQGRAGAARANNGLTEYKGVSFPPGQNLAISPADKDNGVQEKAQVFMVSEQWRERTSGQNTWQTWVSPPADTNPSDRLKFALTTLASAPQHFGSGGLIGIELWKMKGQWFYVFPGAIDPVRQRIPASEVTEHKVACDAASLKMGLPPKVIIAPNSVHCVDSLNNPVPVQEVRREDAVGWCRITPERWDELNGKRPTASAPVAPGHSLTDTYAQAQAIAQANASKGIRDIINPSYLKARLPLPVCFSIDATGNCQKSGETIWLPGDLAQPLDWTKFSQAGACRPPQPDQIEVVLKSTPTDDKRKRFIRCGVTGILAGVRKDLVTLGVKDEGTMTSSAAVIPPVAKAQQPAPRPATNSVEPTPGKDAYTTRAFPDPQGKGPGCEIEEGTLVAIQTLNKQTGTIEVHILPNSKRHSRDCTNFMTVDRSSLRVIDGYPSPK